MKFFKVYKVESKLRAKKDHGSFVLLPDRFGATYVLFCFFIARGFCFNFDLPDFKMDKPTKEQYQALHQAIRQKWEKQVSVYAAYNELKHEMDFNFSKKTVSRDYHKFSGETRRKDKSRQKLEDDDQKDTEKDDQTDDDDSSEKGDNQQTTKLKEFKRMAVLLHLKKTKMKAKTLAIVEALNTCFGPNFVTKAFVYKWAKRFKTGQVSVNSQPNVGRPKKISDEALEEFLKSNPDAKTKQIAEHFNVGQNLIRRRLNETGNKSRIG